MPSLTILKVICYWLECILIFQLNSLDMQGTNTIIIYTNIFVCTKFDIESNFFIIFAFWLFDSNFILVPGSTVLLSSAQHCSKADGYDKKLWCFNLRSKLNTFHASSPSCVQIAERKITLNSTWSSKIYCNL